MPFTVFGIVNPNADAVETVSRPAVVSFVCNLESQIKQELNKIIQMVKENEPGNISYDVFNQANIEDGKQTFIIHQM